MILSKSTEYAIRALVFIYIQSMSGKRPTVEEISIKIDAPQAFTVKIMHTLARYEIIKTLEGDRIFCKCGFGLNSCNEEYPCPLHSKYMNLRIGFRELMESETINSMANKIEQGEAVLYT